jgi:hypothetical protein
MGWPFLWVLSFGQAKESTSAVGPRPGLKTTRRDSDTKPLNQPETLKLIPAYQT